MRSKAKWFLLSGLVTLLVVPALGCGFLGALLTPSSINSQQAIAIIQIVGVPYIDNYYTEAIGEEEAQASGDIGPVTPVGEWVANYQGDGRWIVQGPVTTNSWGDCLTTWTLRESDTEVQLIGFDCD